ILTSSRFSGSAPLRTARRAAVTLLHGRDRMQYLLEGLDLGAVLERRIGMLLQMLDDDEQRIRDLTELLAIGTDIRQHVLLDLRGRGLADRDVDQPKLAASGAEERRDRIDRLDDIPRQGQLEHRHTISPSLTLDRHGNTSTATLAFGWTRISASAF